MVKIFGVTTNSMFNIHTTMAARYGRRNIALLTNDLTKIKKRRYQRRLRQAKLIMAGSVRDMQANILLLRKCAAPLIIFDNPLILRNYSLQLLDAVASDKLIVKFNNATLDYASLIDTIDNPGQRRHRIVRNAPEILPQIISEYTVSGFFDKFNTLLYIITSASNRTEIRSILVRFIFGKFPANELDRLLQINKIKLTTKSRPLYQAVIDYMASDKGVILRQALTEAIKMETEIVKANGQVKRTVRYKEISEKFGVDRFDLKNLILLYRGL